MSEWVTIGKIFNVVSKHDYVYFWCNPSIIQSSHNNPTIRIKIEQKNKWMRKLSWIEWSKWNELKKKTFLRSQSVHFSLALTHSLFLVLLHKRTKDVTQNEYSVCTIINNSQLGSRIQFLLNKSMHTHIFLHDSAPLMEMEMWFL